MLLYLYVSVFFFKQKTAYEMRISDWSSDVCSSDLEQPFERVDPFGKPLAVIEPVDADRDRALARAAAEPLLRSPGDPGLAERHDFIMVDADGKGAGDGAAIADADRAAILVDLRAAEHTSELQSLMRNSYAIICFKKKTTIHNIN